MTYTDEDSDLITMANGPDPVDYQGLNPLRLEVTLKRIKSTVKTIPGGHKDSTPCVDEVDLQGLLEGLLPESVTMEIKQILSRYPDYRLSSVPAYLLPKAVDIFLKTLARESEQEIFPTNCNADEHIPLVHDDTTCDICGMTPIKGPRYMSLRKNDYDLCSHCFVEYGNSNDYHKIDCSMVQKNNQCPSSTRRNYIPSLKSPLNAEFIADITVPDGTILEAGTKFTKIWRLRNSGVFSWPQHTKLVHVGGQPFHSEFYTDTKLSEGGLSHGRMIDIPVNLVAPTIPGQYSGHWSLMAPSGLMFGNFVSVMIHVTPNNNTKAKCCEASDACKSKVNNSSTLPSTLSSKFLTGSQSASADEPEKPWKITTDDKSENHRKELVWSNQWDHLLKGLEEMGFYDMPKNKVLISKNQGSIKLTVKELVEMENQN